MPEDPLRALFDTAFMRVPMAQHWADLLAWEKFLNQHPVAQVLELGSWRGGFSLYLLMQCTQRDIGFHTFDTCYPQAMGTRLGFQLNLARHFIRGDIFDAQGAKSDLDNLLAGSGGHPCLLFCDGGNKKREFATFVPTLYPGDFVAVHDWGTEFGQEDVDALSGLTEPVLGEVYQMVGSITRFFKRV